MSYIVERKPGIFEEVGAPTWKVDAGTLAFFDDSGDLVVAYAQGQWLTVVPEAD